MHDGPFCDHAIRWIRREHRERRRDESGGCTWTTSSNASWLTLNGASYSGAASVGFNIAANTTQSARTGTMTIAGQNFTVSQAGVSCSYTIAPNSQALATAGGAGSVNVTAPTGCAWGASSSAGWLTITSGASGSGNGTVSYNVAVNATTSARVATVSVGGQSSTVGSATVTSVPVADDFNRADGSLGSAWTAQSANTLLLTSASVRGPNDDFVCASRSLASTTFSNDQSSQVTIARLDRADSIGVTVRSSGSLTAGTFSGYLLTADGSTFSTLDKIVSGVGSQILDLSSVAWSAGDVLKLAVSGRTLTAYRNGVAIGTITDPDCRFGSAGRVHLRVIRGREWHVVRRLGRRDERDVGDFVCRIDDNLVDAVERSGAHGDAGRCELRLCALRSQPGLYGSWRNGFGECVRAGRVRLDRQQQRAMADGNRRCERKWRGNGGVQRVGQHQHHSADCDAHDCRPDLHCHPGGSELLDYGVRNESIFRRGGRRGIDCRHGSCGLCLVGQQQRVLAADGVGHERNRRGPGDLQRHGEYDHHGAHGVPHHRWTNFHGVAGRCELFLHTFDLRPVLPGWRRTGSVAVTAPAGCTWAASSTASWLTITSGASGNGNGTVAYNAGVNTTTSARSATLSVGGQTVTVSTAADNFNRPNGAAGANWIAQKTDASPLLGNMLSIAGSAMVGVSGDFVCSGWNAATTGFGGDQSAQATVVALGPSDAVFVSVRSAGSSANGNFSGYLLAGDAAGSPYSTLVKVVNGTQLELLSLSTVSWAAGDVIKLSVTGQTLTAYKNGVVVGTID